MAAPFTASDADRRGQLDEEQAANQGRRGRTGWGPTQRPSARLPGPLPRWAAAHAAAWAPTRQQEELQRRGIRTGAGCWHAAGF
eukprot:191751-Lingulodinium_polyedra.AAC.1